MSNEPRTPDCNPEVVLSPQSRIKKIGRKTAKVLDWTLLPLHEMKLLGKSVVMVKTMVSGIFKTVRSLFTLDIKNSFNSGFFKSLVELSDKDLFVQRLSATDKDALLNLPKNFFLKRIASLSFCLIACALGVYMIISAVTSSDVSLLRLIVLSLMLCFLALYTWVGLVRVDNMAHSIKQLKADQQEGSS